MKYVIVLGDGMADEPIEAAGGKTPLQLADKPVMDEMAKVSEQGIAYTVPSNLPAGSDVANLSMLGYDPQVYYSGRSPLEALSIGVDMKDTDIALRCNVVTVSEDEDYEDKTIIDHSAGEITSEEAAILIEAVRKELEDDEYKFYPGVSYRHLTIWDHGEVVELVPPHDVLGQKIGQYLPKQEKLKEMMEKIFPPGPSMTYRQVRQKKQKYIVSTSQDVIGIQSLNAAIIRQPLSSYTLIRNNRHNFYII